MNGYRQKKRGNNENKNTRIRNVKTVKVIGHIRPLILKNQLPNEERKNANNNKNFQNLIKMLK